MIARSLIVLLVFLVSVWLFVRKQPKTARLAELRRFNISVMGIAAIAVGAVTLYFWATVDGVWWPVLAALSALLLVGLIFIVGVIVRFFVFRGRSAQ